MGGGGGGAQRFLNINGNHQKLAIADIRIDEALLTAYNIRESTCGSLPSDVEPRSAAHIRSTCGSGHPDVEPRPAAHSRVWLKITNFFLLGFAQIFFYH